MSEFFERSPLVTLSDIADLTGLSRSAVSNWRRRFDDFPPPDAGTPSNPQFRLSAVTRWLEAHPGLGGREPSQADAAVVRLWAALNAHRGRIPAELGVEALLSLVTWQHLLRRHTDGVSESPLAVTGPADGREVNQAWRHAIHRYESAHPQHAGLFDPLADIDPVVLADLTPAARMLAASDNDAALFEDLLERHRRASGRSRSEWSTSPELAKLLVDLADPIHGRVYDATAGIGELLVTAANAAERPVELLGQELDATAWRIATQRLIVHDLQARVARGDTLRHDLLPDLQADIVFIDAPAELKWTADNAFTDPRWAYGPPSGVADLAWVQHAIAHVAGDDRRAFVVVPDAAGYRRGKDTRIRAELVRSGSVEAVLGLPTNITPGTNIRRSVWVVSRPGANHHHGGQILFADPMADDAGDAGDAADALVAVYKNWRRGSAGGVLDVRWARVVPALEILGPEVELTPTRWLTPVVDEPATEVVEQLHDVVNEANTALGKIANLPELDPAALQPRFDRAPRATIRQLMEDGLITVRRGIPKGKLQTGGADGFPALTAGFFGRHGEPTTMAGPIAPDQLTRPGDIVVVTDMQIRAVVVRQKYVPVAPVHVISITPRSAALDPDYLAECLNSRWNQRFLTGSGIKHARLPQLEVVVATADEQRAVVRFLAQMRGAMDAATQLSYALTRLRDDTLQALLAGVVTVEASEVRGHENHRADDSRLHDDAWHNRADGDDRPGAHR